MPVTEFGERGILVKPDEENKMVIHWRVTRQVESADSDNMLYGWKAGDPLYRTSMGWLSGNLDKSDYFEPTPGERSLRPYILRALNYATKKWPGWRNETH